MKCRTLVNSQRFVLSIGNIDATLFHLQSAETLILFSFFAYQNIKKHPQKQNAIAKLQKFSVWPKTARSGQIENSHSFLMFHMFGANLWTLYYPTKKTQKVALFLDKARQWRRRKKEQNCAIEKDLASRKSALR